jgi:hypothetical protein
MSAVDPVILFFLLGVGAGLARSDLRLPPALYDFLSMYLLLSIGLKGGVELAEQPFSPLIPQIAMVFVMGLVLPLLGYPLLRHLGRLRRVDAAAIAAHYGSVSVGTFAVAVAYLGTRGIPFESHVALFLVILEMPAILVGVVLARGLPGGSRWVHLAHEILAGKAIALLSGGLLIGWVSDAESLASLEGFFFGLFRGFLALFLLEMGLICSGQIASLRRYGLFLAAFGVLMPVFSALVGCLVGLVLGLSTGGTALVGVLAASASYIAVPAAMRISVPEANPTLSLGASLGVTFPFNVTLGIPLYLKMAQWLHGG